MCLFFPQMHKVVLTVLSILVYPCCARVKYHAQTIPACYIDTSGSARCTHPAYDYCNAGNGGVCCGPDHYCCDSGCCQEYVSINHLPKARLPTDRILNRRFNKKKKIDRCPVWHPSLSHCRQKRNAYSNFTSLSEIVSEYDQEIPQSQTADNPVGPRGRVAQPSRDTRKAN